MRLGSARALFIAMVLVQCVARWRAKQPLSIEVECKAQSQLANDFYGGLKPKPTAVSGRLHASLEAFGVKVEPAPGLSAAPQASPPQATHRFWDRTNDLLFAAGGAGRALDYASSLNLRRHGVDEIFLTNSLVDSHPLFAEIEASGPDAPVRVSYLC